MRNLLLMVGLLFSITAVANAQTYDEDFQFYGDDVNGDAVAIPGLTASLSYSLGTASYNGVSDTTTFVMENFLITNTSSITSNLTGVGFNIGTNATINSVTYGGDVFGDTDEFSGTHVPGGFPNVLGGTLDLTNLDICLDTDGGSCNGSGGGLAMGDFDEFSLTMVLGGNVTGLTIDPIGMRMQGFTYVMDDQFTISSGVGMVSGVPEPATWLMMIVGFGIIASSARRARRRTSNLA